MNTSQFIAEAAKSSIIDTAKIGDFQLNGEGRAAAIGAAKAFVNETGMFADVQIRDGKYTAYAYDGAVNHFPEFTPLRVFSSHNWETITPEYEQEILGK